MNHIKEILPLLRGHLPPWSRFSTPEEAKTLPAAPGSYLLILRLTETCPLLHARHRGQVLPPGLYLYAGSARGPGGLRARVGRHLRREKRCRWHVDALTSRAAEMGALLYPGDDVSECMLISRLLRLSALQPALPGLGSSDCRACPAHLLRFLHQME
jgi:Uri superfamily endonuclease